jgi:hypothetical protein
VRWLADLMAKTGEFFGQARRALAGPAQRRHRIAPARRLDKRIQIGKQAGVQIDQPLASASGGTNASARRHFKR